jgi:arylsulfatase A-like enzyme
MEAEITSHAVDFIKRNANAAKPFYAYVSFSLVHFPTLPNPEFAGKTGNGDWADCLAEMDYRTGQILDAIKEAGIEENTIVIFASDNGPERRPTRGRVTADHGAAPISRRWKPHCVRPSLFDGRVRSRRALSTTRSFTLYTSIRPLPGWVERRSRRIARLTVSINWISS